MPFLLDVHPFYYYKVYENLVLVNFFLLSLCFPKTSQIYGILTY